MARPGGTIQLFWEPVVTTSRPQASVSNGIGTEATDAVDDEQRIGCAVMDGRRDRLQRVRDPGGGLVVRDEHRAGGRAGRGQGAELFHDDRGSAALTPLHGVASSHARRTRLAMDAMRSPKTPMLTASTWSPRTGS